MKENLLLNLINKKPIQLLFKIFNNNSNKISLVGGCVRDILMGKISNDIDIAANIIPSEVLVILIKNKLKYEDYAFNYGSIITYIEGQKFQITSLREDVNQMGRQTNIIFTNDWKKDASRRDFTINSLYLSQDGKLKDFFNGREDLKNNTLRFIGNIEESIQEDFLRILRYYRFLGIFENPLIIKKYDEILSQYFEKSFKYLSNDLIRQEILKMFNTPFPRNCFFIKNSKKKKYWIDLVAKHFIDSNYEIGLKKCLNKISLHS